MIKKLFILVFLALPLSLAAQNLKFGTVNTVDVFNLMPEKATAEKQLEDLSKQYEDAGRVYDQIQGLCKQSGFHAREYQTTPYAGNTGNTTTYSEFP